MYLIELKNCKHFIKRCVLFWSLSQLIHFEALNPKKEPPNIFSGQYPLKMAWDWMDSDQVKNNVAQFGAKTKMYQFLILFFSSVYWNKRKEFVKFQRHVHFLGPCDFWKKKTLFRSADFWNWAPKNKCYLMGSNVSNIEKVLNHSTL